VFGRRPQYYRWTTPLEYRLFASKKQWKAGPKIAPKPVPKKPAKGKKKKQRAGGNLPIANNANYSWTTEAPILVRAMVLADTTLFIAGPRDVMDEAKGGKGGGITDLARKQEAALLGKSGGVLWAVSAADGKKLSELKLDSPPIFDGMAAAGGRIYMATMDGKVICFK
jgi:hypothetical protein